VRAGGRSRFGGAALLGLQGLDLGAPQPVARESVPTVAAARCTTLVHVAATGQQRPGQWQACSGLTDRWAFTDDLQRRVLKRGRTVPGPQTAPSQAADPAETKTPTAC
jgi:hypothetical protein